jgi:hypothetical protein
MALVKSNPSLDNHVHQLRSDAAMPRTWQQVLAEITRTPKEGATSHLTSAPRSVIDERDMHAADASPCVGFQPRCPVNVLFGGVRPFDKGVTK